MTSSDLLFTVDSLVERGGLVFGWGWVLAPGDVVRDVWITVDGAGGRSRIECSVSGIRADASRSGTDAFGFVIAGKLPESYHQDSALLHVMREVGGPVSQALPGFPSSLVQAPGFGKRLRHRIGLLRRRLRTPRTSGAGQGSGADLSDATKKQGHQEPTARERPSAELVIDHSMGGGANKFADQLIAARLLEGRELVILRPILASLGYSVERRRGQGSHARSFSDLSEALAYLSAGEYATVHCNHLVSYESVRDVTDFCEQQASRGTEIIFYVHDYFAVCPSWALMDASDRFCNIPEPDVCARCLPNNPALFVSYFRDQGVEGWREDWRKLLSLFSSIVVFSESTRTLILRVYPEIESRMLLRPHQVDLRPVHPPAWRPEHRWVIGVFGHISRHKGADILVDIAELAEQRGLPMEFLVFGSLSSRPRSAQLRVMGPYESKDMERIAIQYNLLVTLIPSVCSETFSYVTAELMHLHLPVAVFNLGAPADRVRAYPSGLVMESLDPAAALTELENFCRRQSAERGSSAPASKSKRKFQ